MSEFSTLVNEANADPFYEHPQETQLTTFIMPPTRVADEIFGEHKRTPCFYVV